VNKVPAGLTLAVLLFAAPALHAQEFYSDLLQRGISDALSGTWAKAANELRIAAFGSVTDMKQYQTAQVYLAVVNDRLGRTEDARAAATKAVQAERISPVYATASIDAATRRSFEQLLPKLLTATRYAELPAFSRGSTTVAQVAPVPVPMPQAPVQPVPVRPAPVQPAPMPVSRPVPPPAPAPKLVTAPAPSMARPLPQTPAPQRVTQAAPPRPATAQPATLTAPPQPATPQPATVQSPLAAAAARRAPSQSAHFADFAPRLAEAQRLLNEGKMIAARQAYLGIARTADAPRSALLEAAKGLSQTNAWTDSSIVYSKLFPLQKGEEPHYFYEAVNRFELGELTVARDLLSRALPFVGNSREVSMYRGRIEGTVQ
jgi:hypothetical protein